MTGVGGFLLLNHHDSPSGSATVLAVVSLVALFTTSRHCGLSYLCARETDLGGFPCAERAGAIDRRRAVARGYVLPAVMFGGSTGLTARAT